MIQTPDNGIRSFLAWVWAGVLIVAGMVFLAMNFGVAGVGSLLGPIFAAGVAALGIPFLARWIVHRKETWAIITAWVFFSIAILVGLLILEVHPVQLIGIVALLEIGAPFTAAYLFKKENRWMLIPAYVMLALSVLLALTMLHLSTEILGAVGLLTAALPFWVIYINNRTNWWALLPAGIIGLLGSGMLVLFSLAQQPSGIFYVVLNAMLAAVFVAVWLAFRQFDGALWIASGFTVAAVLSIWFPSTRNWAVLALALGLYIAYRQIDAAQKKTATAKQAGTQSAPSAPAPPPPAQTQPSQPAAPPAQTPSPGVSPQAIDKAATAKAQESGTAPPERSPAVGFRPIDPLQDRTGDEDT